MHANISKVSTLVLQTIPVRVKCALDLTTFRINTFSLLSKHKHLNSNMFFFFSLSAHTCGQIQKFGTAAFSAAVTPVTNISLMLTQRRVRQRQRTC